MASSTRSAPTSLFLVVVLLGLNFFLALPVAIVGGLLLGALIEFVLLRPMRGADIDTTMLVMIGAMIVMQNGEQSDLGRRRQVGHDALSRDAAGDRPGLGVLAARVRVRRCARS